MNWAQDHLIQSIFDLLFHPIEKIQQRIKRRGRQPPDTLADIKERLSHYIDSLTIIPHYWGAEANVVHISGQPAEDAVDNSSDIILPTENGDLINISDFFRYMDLEEIEMCRNWFILLLGSLCQHLTNDQRQIMECYQNLLYDFIRSKNNVNRIAFGVINSELVFRRNNVPRRVINTFSLYAQMIVSIVKNQFDDQLDDQSIEQGIIRNLYSLVSEAVFTLYKIFIGIITYIPRNLFSRIFRRYENSHRS